MVPAVLTRQLDRCNGGRLCPYGFRVRRTNSADNQVETNNIAREMAYAPLHLFLSVSYSFLFK